jgi:hypothetical protein
MHELKIHKNKNLMAEGKARAKARLLSSCWTEELQSGRGTKLLAMAKPTMIKSADTGSLHKPCAKHYGQGEESRRKLIPDKRSQHGNQRSNRHMRLENGGTY